MIDLAALRVGDKVYYQPEGYGPNRWANGVVKEVPDLATDPDSANYNSVRVVYSCNGDWAEFKEYTSELTRLSDLTLGWKHTEQSCTHEGWSFAEHGRCCGTCGTLLVDFGD
jgi:hypothetical protein